MLHEKTQKKPYEKNRHGTLKSLWKDKKADEIVINVA